MKFLVKAIRFFFEDHPIYPSVSIYFQGCDAFPKCTGCHNQDTWDFDESFAVEYDEISSLVIQKTDLLLLEYETIAICFLGGEPLSSRNRECVRLLSWEMKQKYADRIVNVLYSWREPKDLQDLEKYVEYIDEFVLGKFEIKLKTRGFPASSNQLYIKRRQPDDFLKADRRDCYALETFR